jgi:hypothetical protein
MIASVPKHYSNSFRFNLSCENPKASDRISATFVCPGIILGLILITLGIYDFFTTNIQQAAILPIELNSQNVDVDMSYSKYFAFAFIIIGFWTSFSLILSYLKYKKILFNKDSITILYRSSFGYKKIVTEPKSNYVGVCYRTELCQYGIFSRIKFIIELINEDEKKTVPLYISTKEANARNIWEDYARTLELPAVVINDNKFHFREVKDLDKSIKQLVAEKIIPDDYDPNELPPENFAIKYDKHIILKPKKVNWNISSFFLWVTLILNISVLLGLISQHLQILQRIGLTPIIALYVALTMPIFYLALKLSKKHKLVIKKNKLVSVYKRMIFTKKNKEIWKDHIEAVVTLYDPKRDYYFLTIFSDTKTIEYGRGLPKETLDWVKRFLIHHLAQ